MKKLLCKIQGASGADVEFYYAQTGTMGKAVLW